MGRKESKTNESFNRELMNFSDGHFSLFGKYVTASKGKCKIKCNVTNKIFERECRNALKTRGCPFCSDKKYLFEPPEKRYFNPESVNVACRLISFFICYVLTDECLLIAIK